MTGGAPGLYVHVPFCRTKCPYCDFYSREGGEPRRWLDALDAEATERAHDFAPFDTIYVGGGTPSVLSPEELRRLFSLLRRRLPLAPSCEVTVEVNPDDVTGELLATLRQLGVGRLSVGVQSFDDERLRFLGRRHDGDGARRALGAAREAGFAELSVDLMHSFSDTSTLDVIADLDEALAFDPEHLSCYALTVEDRTPFGRRALRGELSTADEELGRACFLATAGHLGARGYEHYEVSNFALDGGHRSGHNQKYWRRSPYLGLGPSAHSFDGARRWWNVRDVDTYCESLASGASAVDSTEVLTDAQVLLEELMLGLRTSDGVAIETLRRATPRWEPIAAELEAEGLASRSGDRLCPTSEGGLLMADGLPLRFLTP